VTGLPFTVIETADMRVSSSNQDPKALPVVLRGRRSQFPTQSWRYRLKSCD